MFVGGVRVCVSRESEWKEEVHSKQEKQREGEEGRERGEGNGIEYACACIYLEILTSQFACRGQEDSERLGVIYHGELSKGDVLPH